MRNLCSAYIFVVYLVVFQILSVFSTTTSHAQPTIEATESQSQALELLSAYQAAKEHDAYLHMLALEQKLPSISDDRKLAGHFKDLIYTAIDMSDFERQLRYAELSLPLAFRLEDIELRVYSEVAHANALSLEGEYLAARRKFASARKLAEIRGTKDLVFFVDIVEAGLGPETGHYLEGLAKMAQTEPTLPDTPEGNKLRILALLTIAYNYTAADDIPGMIEYYGRALNVAQDANLFIDRETIAYNFASVLTQKHQFEDADKAFNVLHEIIHQTENKSNEFYLFAGLAKLENEIGNFDKSNKYALKGLAPAIKGGTPYHIARIHGIMALNYARLGDTDKAQEHLDVEEEYYAKYPDAKQLNFEHNQKLVQAYIAMALGENEKGFKLLDDSRQMQVDNQFMTFRESLAEMQSSLQIIISKQETETKLEAAETAYLRATWVAGILGAFGLLAMFIQQRKHTRQLQRSMDDAKTANQAKSEFLANMSHELRTPLNAILGFSEMMTHQVFGKLGARQYEEYVGHIHHSGRHLLDIINDILDLSKVESGKLQLQEEDIDLCTMFQDVRTVLEPKAQKLQQNISVVVDEDVPYLHADRRLIKQILLNLLSNGVKFTPPHGNIRLIGHKLEDGAIQMEVADTGIGMTPQELEVALTPFGQAGTTSTRSHEGTGLGLPLVKDLVELHGGTIKINTRKNIGTSVLITFPVERSGCQRVVNCADCEFEKRPDICPRHEFATEL